MPSGSETVLLVEDDAAVRQLTCHVLEKQGYQVLEAENGQEALKLVSTYTQPIHLLITDVVMPEMDGVSLARQLTTIYPHLKTIYISGYIDRSIAGHDIPDSEIRLLQKPFSAMALALEVRSTLDEGTKE